MKSEENTDLVAPVEDDELDFEAIKVVWDAEDQAARMSQVHLQFAEAILRGKPRIQSWIELNPGCSERGASTYSKQVLKRKDVANYLRLRRREIAERTNITAERLEQELAYIAFARATDVMKWGKDGVAFIPSDELTPEQAAAVESVKSRRRTKKLEDGSEVTTVELELKMHSKESAIEKLMKARGLYQQDRKNDADVQRELLATVVMRFVMALHLHKGMGFHEAMKYAEQNPEEVEAWGKEVKLLNA